MRALWVHPDGQRIYAASGNGGVWYSSDGAESWKSIGGFAETDTPDIVRPAHRHACGAITVVLGADSNDQTLDTVYVGTGEITPGRTAHAGSTLGGIGILVATGPASAISDDPWVEEAPNLLHEGVYRFAVDPNGPTVVAATTVGLLQRPAGAGQDDDWEPVAGDPFDDFKGVVTDVLWTAAVAGGAPERLWAWATGDKAGLWVRSGTETKFERVATPGAKKRRSSLAAADPPSRIYVFNDQGKGTIAKLFEVTSTGADPTAAEVTGLPDMLGHQGFYDLAVRVDPNDADRVILGGSFFEGPPDEPSRSGAERQRHQRGLRGRRGDLLRQGGRRRRLADLRHGGTAAGADRRRMPRRCSRPAVLRHRRPPLGGVRRRRLPFDLPRPELGVRGDEQRARCRGSELRRLPSHL